MAEGRILTLDVGTKRVGLAISDPLGFSAQGLDSLPYKGEDYLVESLKALISKYNIKALIVGLPLNLNGTIGQNARQVIALVASLKKRLNLPVKTWDERLTSLEAERIMLKADISRRRRRQVKDRLSAQIILQSYLDAHGDVKWNKTDVLEYKIAGNCKSHYLQKD